VGSVTTLNPDPRVFFQSVLNVVRFSSVTNLPWIELFTSAGAWMNCFLKQASVIRLTGASGSLRCVPCARPMTRKLLCPPLRFHTTTEPAFRGTFSAAHEASVAIAPRPVIFFFSVFYRVFWTPAPRFLAPSDLLIQFLSRGSACSPRFS